MAHKRPHHTFLRQIRGTMTVTLIQMWTALILIRELTFISQPVISEKLSIRSTILPQAKLEQVGFRQTLVAILLHMEEVMLRTKARQSAIHLQRTQGVKIVRVTRERSMVFKA